MFRPSARNAPSQQSPGAKLPPGRPMPRLAGATGQRIVPHTIATTQFPPHVPVPNPYTVGEFVEVVQTNPSALPAGYEIYGDILELRASTVPDCESLLEALLTAHHNGEKDSSVSSAQIPLTLTLDYAQYNSPYLDALKNDSTSPVTVFVNSSKARGHGIISPLGFLEFNEQWTTLMNKVETVYIPTPKLFIPGQVKQIPIYNVETALQHFNANNISSDFYGVYGILSEIRGPTEDSEHKDLQLLLTDDKENRLKIRTTNSVDRVKLIEPELQSLMTTPVIVYITAAQGIAEYMQIPIGGISFSDAWDHIQDTMNAKNMPQLKPLPLVPPSQIKSIYNNA